MCAIIGGLTSDFFEDDLIQGALDLMMHRGPDDSGLFRHRQMFLGARRLAIIDTAGGHQPIGNEDGSVVAVLNGEIYNYRELTKILQDKGHRFATHCDTEVLVHGYEEWGERLLEKLRGMFAFAIWEQRENKFLLGRDRFGKKPFYYFNRGSKGIVFASEIKALRALLPNDCWAIEEQNVYDYLSLLAVPQPNTVFRNVKMLPAGSLGVYRSGVLSIRNYWELPSEPLNSNLDYSEAQQLLRNTIEESVRLRLRSDVPLGVFLSGGIDSTIIAYEAARELGSGLRTFTVAVEDSELNEAPVAERTAQKLGVKNEVIHLALNPVDLLEKVVPHFDQPFADASAIPSYAVASKARQFVTVVLNGDGGDELFGGYRRYVAAALMDQIPLLRFAGRFGGQSLVHLLTRSRRDFAGFMDRLLRGIRTNGGQRYLTWTTDALFEAEKQAIWKGGPVRPTEALIETLLPHNASTLRTQMVADQRIILPGLLVKMDMATMLASVEARSPFLDHQLAELAASFPDHFLVRGRKAKAILRDAYRDVLPQEVLTAQKRGFEIPLERWLAVELRDMIHDLLGSPSARIGGFLETGYIRSILGGTTLKERNRGYIIYSLLVLELWLRACDTSVVQPEAVALS